MAVKNLNNEEMHQISAGWLDPQKGAHQAILSIDLLKSQLPLLAQAHQGISNILRPIEDPRIANIIAVETEKDLRHDSIIRGAHGTLTAMAELIGGDEGAALLQLRDTLIPDGLPSVSKSYRAEATQAAELKKALTPEVRKRTDSILIGEGGPTLTAYLEEWIALGRDLGDLEDQKGALLAAQASAGSASTVPARNYWVRVVNAFVSNAELIGISDEAAAAIFGPLRDAEAKADARSRAGSKRSKQADDAKPAAEKPAEKATPEKAPAEKAAPEKAGEGTPA